MWAILELRSLPSLLPERQLEVPHTGHRLPGRCLQYAVVLVGAGTLYLLVHPLAQMTGSNCLYCLAAWILLKTAWL